MDVGKFKKLPILGILRSDSNVAVEDLVEAVISAGKASTSYIQRKLGIGYSRAAKLMDILEERGVIGPANGSKPREIMGGSSRGSSDGASSTDDSDNNSNDTENSKDEGSTVPEEI